MIDIRKLKELVRLMVANDLTELDLRDSEEQVTLRRPGPAGTVFPAPPPAGNHALAPPSVAAPPPAAGSTATPPPADETPQNLIRIESPMVGTFYSKPDPDADPFVTVGTRVGPDTVVCLVEAMKIFNEIKAEVSGTVHEVLVESGAAVEFGQPLYTLRPD